MGKPNLIFIPCDQVSLNLQMWSCEMWTSSCWFHSWGALETPKLFKNELTSNATLYLTHFRHPHASQKTTEGCRSGYKRSRAKSAIQIHGGIVTYLYWRDLHAMFDICRQERDMKDRRKSSKLDMCDGSKDNDSTRQLALSGAALLSAASRNPYVFIIACWICVWSSVDAFVVWKREERGANIMWWTTYWSSLDCQLALV